MILHQLSDEQERILTAAAEGRLKINQSGRYYIEGGARPDRKEREKLQRWFWLGWRIRKSDTQIVITEEGRVALGVLSARTPR